MQVLDVFRRWKPSRSLLRSISNNADYAPERGRNEEVEKKVGDLDIGLDIGFVVCEGEPLGLGGESIDDDRKEYFRGYNVRTQDKRKEYYREYYDRNKDSLGGSHRDYSVRKMDHRKEYYREYNIRNKDTIRESKRIYRMKNKDNKKLYSTNYYLENKDVLREWHREYNNRNKTSRQEYFRKYYVRSLENPNNYSPRYDIKSWKSPEIVREYFESIASLLGVVTHTDWYRVSRPQVGELGGVLQSFHIYIFLPSSIFYFLLSFFLIPHS
jgi:hypothetical protein